MSQVSLGSIIQKLDHSILDIRRGSLHSIVSKLQNGLVTVDDLAKEEMLFVKLMDWMREGDQADAETAMELIHTLTQSERAAEILREVGAFRVFEKLRGESKTADKIIIRLQEHQPPSSALDAPEFVAMPYPRDVFVLDSAPPSLVLTESSAPSNETTMVQEDHQARHTDSLPLTYFPWQFLCEADKEALKSLNLSLASSGCGEVMEACEFFSEVVLQDFPAEVFLQRPATLQALLSIIHAKERYQMCTVAVRSLHRLSDALQARVAYYLDPTNYAIKQVSSVPDSLLSLTRKPTSPNFEDSTQLGYQQVTLPQFCTTLIQEAVPLTSSTDPNLRNAALYLLEYILRLAGTCITPAVVQDISSQARETCEEIIHAMQTLGDILTHICAIDRATYVMLLGISVRLLDILYIDQEELVTMPENLRRSLVEAIFDPVLPHKYSRLHSQVKKYVEQVDCAAVSAFERAWDVCQSIECAGSLLQNMPSATAELANNCFDSIGFHMSPDIVSACFYILSTRPEDDGVEKLAVRLLAYTDLQVRAMAYSSCAAHVREALGVSQAANIDLSESGRIQFLLNAVILSEIVMFGLSDSAEEVHGEAEEILIYLLKGKWVMKPQQWNKLLSEIMPLLPLLECFASTETGIGRLTMDLLNVDSQLLGRTELLRGNVRLLYSREQGVREEALIRIVNLLCKEDPSFEKIPSLVSVSSGVQNDILLVTPRDIARKRDYVPVYQAGNLLKVLDLVRSDDVDGDLRRSGLNQISVMLEDPNLHSLFMEYGGLQVLVEVLEYAVIEKHYVFKPEYIPPILSSFFCLAHHLPECRRNLSRDMNTFTNILRGLFLFRSEEKVVQDASCLLAFLIYEEMILSVPDSPDGLWFKTSLPDVIARYMSLPIKGHTHWVTSPNTELRINLDFEIANPMGILRVGWKQAMTDNVKCSLIMTLTEEEKILLDAADHEETSKQVMARIESAISHDSVMSELAALEAQILVVQCSDNNNMQLPWEPTFSRFLAVFPASLPDEELLCDILRILETFLKRFQDKGLTGWLGMILSDSKHLFYSVIPRSRSRWGEVDKKKRRQAAHSRLLTAVVRLMEYMAKCKMGAECEGVMLRALARRIAELCKEEHKHLASLNLLLQPVCLTSRQGWNRVVGKDRDTCSQLVLLCDATNWMFGVGENQQFSFLGKGLCLKAVICLCHVALEMTIEHGTKNWFHLWLPPEEGSTLLWFSSFWAHRDPMVKAASIQILTALVTSPQGHQFVAQQLQDLEGGLWGLAFRFLLDPFEANIVREKAALLMTNMTRNVGKVDEGWGGPVIVDLATKKLTSGVPALMSSLDQNYFYREVRRLTDAYNPSSSISTGVVTSLSQHPKEPLDLDNSDLSLESFLLIPGRRLSSALCHGTEEGPIVRELNCCTPGVIGNICLLLHNVICLDSDKVAARLNEFGILESLLRCMENVPTNNQHWHGATYMYTKACSLIALCGLRDHVVRQHVLHNGKSLDTFVKLLDAELFGKEEQVNELWAEILNLITVALKDADLKKLEPFCAALASGWRGYVLNVKSCLNTKSSTKLSTHSMQCLLAIMLTFDCEVRQFVTWTVGDIISGRILCKSLLNLIEIMEGKDKITLLHTLGALLTVSQEAKIEALESGLIETVAVMIADLNLELSLDTSNTKSKGHPSMPTLQATLMLMNGFVCDCNEVKKEAASSGLMDLLHKVWVWCLLDPGCLHAVLQLVCSFSANCSSASQAMACTSPVLAVSGKKRPSNFSLIHAVVYVVREEMDKMAATQDARNLQYALGTLGNVCCMQECRTVISKSSSILEPFRMLHPGDRRKFRNRTQLEGLWLEFLYNWSQYREGQITIPRAPGSLETLITLCDVSSPENQLIALSVLKNLAFHAPNRVLFRATTSPLFTVMAHKAVEGTDEEKTEVAIAMWATISNSEKGKQALKQSPVMQALAKISSRKDELSDHVEEQLRNIAQIVMNIINADACKTSEFQLMRT